MKKIQCCGKECTWSATECYCEMLNKLGVPQDTKWRSLILFCREISEFRCLTDVQKTDIQRALTSALEKKDFSKLNFDNVLQTQHGITVSPFKKKVEELLREANSIVKDFHGLLAERYINITELEDTVISTVESDLDEKEMIVCLRSAFDSVKVMLENDMRSLEKMAHKDGVTGISNRRAFDMFINDAMDRWQKDGTLVGLAMFDIDFFKRFNDAHGHRIGDQALRVVAKQIAHHAQNFVAADCQVMAARYGGEEFALVVSGAKAADLPQLAEACRIAVRNFNFLIRDANGNVVENGLHITVSAGVALSWKDWHGPLVDNLIDSADKALYFAKASGRDKTVIFAPDEEQRYKLVPPLPAAKPVKA